MSFDLHEVPADDAVSTMLSAIERDRLTGDHAAVPQIILELTNATDLLDADQTLFTAETVQLLAGLGASATPALVEMPEQPTTGEAIFDHDETLQTLEEIRKQIKDLEYRAVHCSDYDEQDEITKQLVLLNNQLQTLPKGEAAMPKVSSLREHCHQIVLDLYADAVSYVVRKRSMPGYDEGLAEVVKFGLLQAFDRFDLTRSNGFLSYAFVFMDGSALRNGRDILRTKGLKRTAYSIYPTLKSLQEQGYEDSEIAIKLGKTPEQIQNILQEIDRAFNLESLDGIWDDPERSFGNYLDVLPVSESPVEDVVTRVELDKPL